MSEFEKISISRSDALKIVKRLVQKELRTFSGPLNLYRNGDRSNKVLKAVDKYKEMVAVYDLMDLISRQRSLF